METSLEFGAAKLRRRWLLLSLSSVAIAVVSLSSCKALTESPASISDFGDSDVVYPLNGSPPGAPNALSVFGGTVLPASGTFAFDVAFDITDSGYIAILPVRTIATGLTATHSVALATVSDTFGAVTSVPNNTTFRADTAMDVLLNQVVLVRVDESSGVCASSATGSYVYAKLVLRTFDTTTHAMTINVGVDPNCGFKSFADGIPTFILRPVHRQTS